MNKSSRASVEVSVAWQSPRSRHVDRCFLGNVNFWRDYFPGSLGEKLAASEVGETICETYAAGELLPEWQDSNLKKLTIQSLGIRTAAGDVSLRNGRYYPRGLLRAVSGIYPQDRQPFRYVGAEDRVHIVDLNHPLAGLELSFEATITEHLEGKEERGGRCNDVIKEACDNGPGIQRTGVSGETDFFSGHPFRRQDAGDDAHFYQQARMVNHLDDYAMEKVRGIYAGRIGPGMRVLDLMASWNSHLPTALTDLQVTGLGMNEEELSANPLLTERVVHDLNRAPVLPFEDETFDAAVCTVSVEYLTSPIEVFQETARVLRPSAPFIVTFSDRWFPPKVVKIWTELHPFERIGLVKAYFRRSNGFESLHAESIRGYPRPPGDKYARVIPLSDPVYAVSGRRK